MSTGQVICTADATLDSGEFCHTFYPTPGTKNGQLVVLCHGAGMPDNFDANTAWPNAAELARVLRRAGYVCIQIYMGGTSMACDTAIGKIVNAISVAKIRAGISPTKVHFIGISMGGMTTIRFSCLYPSMVASANVLVPATNIIGLQQKNPGVAVVGGFAQMIADPIAWNLYWRSVPDAVFDGSAKIARATPHAGDFVSADVGKLLVCNTAPATWAAYATPKVKYGTKISSIATDGSFATMDQTSRGNQALPGIVVGITTPVPTSTPNADIRAMAAAIKTAGVPGRMFYSTVDHFIEPADVTAMATASGWSAIIIDTTYGHADKSMGELSNYGGGSDFSDVLAFIEGHAG